MRPEIKKITALKKTWDQTDGTLGRESYDSGMSKLIFSFIALLSELYIYYILYYIYIIYNYILYIYELFIKTI